MTKYTLTSTNFTGEIVFGYNLDKQLVHFENKMNLDFNGVHWMLTHMPNSEHDLEFIKSKIKGTLTKVPEDLSFERFWDTYKMKINAKRCRPLWDELSEADKILCLLRIPQYFEYVRRKRIGTANPEKFLRERYFETEWLKILYAA